MQQPASADLEGQRGTAREASGPRSTQFGLPGNHATGLSCPAEALASSTVTFRISRLRDRDIS